MRAVYVSKVWCLDRNLPDHAFFGTTHNNLHPGKYWYDRYTNGDHGECLGRILFCYVLSQNCLLPIEYFVCQHQTSRHSFALWHVAVSHNGSKPKLLAAHRILCLPTSNKQAFICFMACCCITQWFHGQYQLASVYFTDTV